MKQQIASIVGVLSFATFLLCFSFSVSAQSTTSLFICPPCDASCDTISFHGAGTCPVCKMPLVEKSKFSAEQIFKKFSTDALEEDLWVLRSALEQSHPNPYWHTSKAVLDKAFDQAYRRINAPMNSLEFARIIFPIVYKIGCGHTVINPPSLTTAYLSQQGSFFPFDLIFKNQRAYVYRNNSENASIAPGTEILQINHLPVQKIRDKLFEFVSVDNNTTAGKYKILNANFADFYNYFIGAVDTFEVQTRYQNKTKTERVAALSKTKIKAFTALNQRTIKTGVSTPDDKIISFSILSKSSTAVLKIKNFIDPWIKAEGYSFESYIDSVFNLIHDHDLKNLVIDIRGNPGGSTGNAAYLFSHLYKQPFRVDQYWEVKTLPLKFIDLSGIRDSEGKSIVLKEEDFNKTGENRYRLKYYPSYDTILPKNNLYKGNLYVLIDGWVGSEAASFASLVAHFNRGRFVGEETGGSYNGCNAGLLGKTVLPNTKIEMTIPVFKIVRFTDAQNEHTGIRPDYKVDPSIDDLLTGVDRALLFTIDKISKHPANSSFSKTMQTQHINMPSPLSKQ
jgi:C-terminal processing protease CtpA/Prc